MAALAAVTAPVGLAGSTFGSSTPVAATQEVHAESSSQPVRFTGRSSDERLVLPKHLVRSQVEGIRGLPTSTTAPDPGVVGELVTVPTTAPAPTTTTTVAPTTTTTAAPAGPAYGDPNDPATWDRLAQCEAGGNWSTNTGNGYYGGLQFSGSSWRAVGGTGLPHQNSREEQIRRGQILQARGGWSQWPACTRKLGYR